MRVNRFLLLLAALFAALLTVYVLTVHLDSAVDPASLLPVDTLALVDIRNPAENHKRFRRSELGSLLHSIKWLEVLRALDVPEDTARDFSAGWVKLRNILDSRLFYELSGRRALLALLPQRSPTGQGDVIPDFAGSLVLISRPNHRASLLDFFSSHFIGAYDYTTQSYAGKEIRTFTLDSDTRLSTAVSDGFIITAFSTKVVKQCLDLSLKNLTRGTSGLLENAEYTSLRQRTQGREDQFFYFDLQGFRNLLDRLPANILPAGRSDYMSTLDALPFKTWCSYRSSGDHTLRYTNILRFDTDNLPLRTREPLYPRPAVNTYLQEIPAELLAFYWTNMIDFRALVQRLRPNDKSMTARLSDEFEKWLYVKTGLSLDSFLSLFGSVFSVNLSEVWTDGFLPMPKICFRLMVHNSDEVSDVLEKMTAGQMVTTSRTGGVEVHSVQLAGGLIQPSYALKNGFLIIADSRQQMEIILSNDKQLLLDDPLFKRVDVGLTESNNMIAFVRNGELVDALREIAVWTGALLALNDPQQQSFRARVLIERVFVPVLEGFKMYLASGSRLYSTESELVFKTSLVLDERGYAGE